MAQHVWSVLCRQPILDRVTNNLSLVGVLEEVQVEIACLKGTETPELPVTTMTIHGPVDRVEVLIEGVVETFDTAGVLRGHRELVSPRVFLQPTAAIKGNAALKELGDSVTAGAEDGALGLAHALSDACLLYTSPSPRDS